MAKYKKTFCCDCGTQLKKNEFALGKKLLGEDSQDLMCLTCLAAFLGCSTADLEAKIAEFKEQGCTSFV